MALPLVGASSEAPLVAQSRSIGRRGRFRVRIALR
jgi:hypothetical protein